MFDINTKEIKEFERDLKAFAHRAYPFATKNTLNKSAFQAQKLTRGDMDTKMIQRNKFTKQSIQVDQARTLNVNRQAATVGSIADYMEDQEFGTVKRKQGKEGIAIATGYAAGQEGQEPRLRLPRKANKMMNIQLQRQRKRGSNRKQQNIIAIRQAATSGRKYVFLDLGRSKGIFKVIGGRRRPKIKMVHDMSRDSVVIPRNPWLKPVVDDVRVMMPGFYRDALVFQLKRQGLFRG